jgi:hypothetical protein
MTIFDAVVLKEIIKVSCHILRENFFYDDENLGIFINTFTDEIGRELDFFASNADSLIVNRLHRDRLARLHFTCYFASAHLREIFIEKMHFSEQELVAFEGILPKYTGEK